MPSVESKLNKLNDYKFFTLLKYGNLTLKDQKQNLKNLNFISENIESALRATVKIKLILILNFQM